MGRYVGMVGAQRLLMLIGAGFGCLLLFQYFEFLYSRIPSSSLTSSNPEVTSVYGFHDGNSSSVLVAKDLMCSNSTDVLLCSISQENSILIADVPASHTAVAEEKDSIHGDDFDGEDGHDLGSGMDDDGMESDDESSSSLDSLEMAQNSNFEDIVKNNGSSVGESENGTTTSSSDSRRVGDAVEISRLDSSSASKLGEISGNVGGDSSKITSDIQNRLEENDDNDDHISITRIPKNDGSPSVQERKALSTSEMKNMLLQSRTSYHAVKPRWPSPVDQALSRARSLVLNAPILKDEMTLHDVTMYRNFSEFKTSYELMEQILKVYIYREGERPAFHQPPLKGIYASEGWFMKLLKSNKRFVTKNPNEAHLFYLPFSSRNLVASLYIPDSHSHDNLIRRLGSFVELIAHKYHFWNRTAGADHFLVACHDWAPVETREVMADCIRALCNADMKEGFQFGKDASLPETYVQTPRNPLRQLGGKRPSERRILAFFAGNMHGYVRPILLKHWQNKDPDMKIMGRVSSKGKGKMSYAEYMKNSRYCICAKGYEVNSPRVVEAIFFECVPVIISDNFVPPFFETLNWESFAVFVAEKDIPNLKNILVSITEERYVEMHRRVKYVQQHFLWHPKPVRHDVFHMILHSVWYNKIFQTGA